MCCASHTQVYEKEKRLRMMMKMHGLGDTAYWLVTYAWYLILYCLYIIVFIIFGSAIRLKIFTMTNYGAAVPGLLSFCFLCIMLLVRWGFVEKRLSNCQLRIRKQYSSL